jgi:hypothetical protein
MLDLIAQPEAPATEMEMVAVLEAQADDLARLNRERDLESLIVAFVSRGYVLKDRLAMSAWLDNSEAGSLVEVWWNDTEVAHQILLVVGAEEINGWHYDWDRADETVGRLFRDLETGL